MPFIDKTPTAAKRRQKILVLGGYGAVGAPLVSELRRQGHAALSAGRDKERADVVIDVRSCSERKSNTGRPQPGGPLACSANPFVT